MAWRKQNNVDYILETKPAFFEFLSMIEFGSAKIEDILLLFIYLELGAMVGIYFKTKHMPLRFLIYVAMTALTRLLFSYIVKIKFIEVID